MKYYYEFVGRAFENHQVAKFGAFQRDVDIWVSREGKQARFRKFIKTEKKTSPKVINY